MSGRATMNDFLIRNGTVLSMDDEIGNVEGCDVLIKDGRIEAVAPGIEAGDTPVIDATDTVIVPGFVDTHRHLWETVLRGILPTCSLGRYFGTMMATYAPNFRPEDVHAGNLVGAYEALNAGVTTVVDWCHCLNTPDHADAAIAALRASGIRSMFAYGWPGGGEWLLDSQLTHPQDARRVKSQYFSSEDGLLTFALALRGPATMDVEVNNRDFALAQDLDARVTVHAGMRITGRPVREVDLIKQAGLLTSKLTFVHCNTTPEEDLRAIADAGATVSISPHVELIMGHGPPVTGRLLACGLRPTLSVDVTTTVPGDMFTQMRSALAYERILAFPDDPYADFEPTLEAMDVLRFATIDGAAACGLEDRTGSLTPGKQADLMLVRTDDINVVPADDPVAALVTSADVSNIDTVLVDGKVVKRHGKLVNVDVRQIGNQARAARQHVMAAVSGG